MVRKYHGFRISIEEFGVSEVMEHLRSRAGLRSVLLAGANAGAREMRKVAKREVVKKSGDLAASLGVAQDKRAPYGIVRVAMGPRLDFRRTVKGKKRRVAIDSSKGRRGRVIGEDAGHPVSYGYFIEFGETKNGKRRRKRGAVRFMRKAQTYISTAEGQQTIRTGIWEKTNKLIAASKNRRRRR